MTGQSKKLIFQGKAFNAVRRIHHVFLERYEDGRANYWLKKQKKKNTGEPIHVAFIVQMPEIWDKEEYYGMGGFETPEEALDAAILDTLNTL